ncbi:hypothetical protein SAMN06298216_0240 [Spirosomataceae bacterium TFI 002]|nr:hypothetical protein SAMN06298216_0240 [Spirosomataceae bacterium TFI 002]
MGIRPFIGCENFKTSREFYNKIGFTESIVSYNMSYFSRDGIGFYLQDAYVKDWVDNSMVFWEVEDVEAVLNELTALDVTKFHSRVRLSEIHYNDWGKEFFLHDPSGVLWHIGSFNK